MRILVAVDETPDGLEPVRLAAGLALGPADEIVTVCIAEPRIFAYGMGAVTGPAPSGMFLAPPSTPSDDPAGVLMSSAAATLAEATCARRIVARDTTPERALRELVGEVDADLVILPATQPRGRLEALAFGDPWGPVIATATVPVLLARPARTGAPNVLVVLDDPRRGADAVRAITRLPMPADAHVLLLGLVSAGTHPGSVRQRQRMVRRTDVAMRVLRRAGIRTASLLRQGDGAPDVLAAAQTFDADVIVIGARRDGGKKRLDAAARSVMGTATCSVLLIPAVTERDRRRSRDDGDDEGRWTVRVPGSSSPETLR